MLPSASEHRGRTNAVTGTKKPAEQFMQVSEGTRPTHTKKIPKIMGLCSVGQIEPTTDALNQKLSYKRQGYARRRLFTCHFT